MRDAVAIAAYKLSATKCTFVHPARGLDKMLAEGNSFKVVGAKAMSSPLVGTDKGVKQIVYLIDGHKSRETASLISD